MSERRPCRACGTFALENTLKLTGGLCGRCARGHKFCEVCKRHITDFPPDKQGHYICGKCREAAKTKDKIRHVNLKARTEASWHPAGPNTIEHTVLGQLTNNGGEWATEPVIIGAFGYYCPIIFDVEEESPTNRQLTAAVNLLNCSEAFRNEVAERMAHVYSEEIRPTYISNSNPAGLPELTSAHDVWTIIEGMNDIWIDEDLEVSLEFTPKFDPNHDFVVRIRDGMFYEVMMDG